MKKGKYWLHLTVILTVSIGCIYSTCISGSIPADDLSKKRSDVIKIDSMAAFGKLEKAPVEFLHDAHTKALAEKDLDCTACHLETKDQIYPKFKRFEDTDRVTVMNVYHDECISCHGEMNLAGEKTGPIKCDDCHTGTYQFTSNRQPMGFDKSLHFRHTKARDNKCEQCHHEYDETKKELFYAKGKEGSCRYCHGEKTVDNQASMPIASHMACVSCHLNIVKENLGTSAVKPPVNCAGCHDPEHQQKIKKMTDIPRMERSQPDTVLLNAALKTGKEIDASTSRMKAVAFNHKAHEMGNDSCRVCHHDSIQSCNECHTQTGVEKTDQEENAPEKSHVILEKAMHDRNSQKSCVGCHNSQKKKADCAGCHALMGQTSLKDDASCTQCHTIPADQANKMTDADQAKSFAASALSSRKKITQTLPDEDIPEIVTIDRISNKYKAVAFPHRKVVKAIAGRIQDHSLSGYFHQNEGTLCQGCHHNTPVSKKPPQCANCHARKWDETQQLKPGIMGAYHQQCMGCHEKMNIEKPVACIECHEPKK